MSSGVTKSCLIDVLNDTLIPATGIFLSALSIRFPLVAFGKFDSLPILNSGNTSWPLKAL